MQNIRAAAVQFNHAPGDKVANLAKIRAFVQTAAAQQVELIVFPEILASQTDFIQMVITGVDGIL